MASECTCHGYYYDQELLAHRSDGITYERCHRCLERDELWPEIMLELTSCREFLVVTHGLHCKHRIRRMKDLFTRAKEMT